MNIKRQPRDSIMVLQISGDIMGGPDFEKFKGEIQSLVDDGFPDIVLDLGRTRYINSTGLGILVSGLHTVRKNEGTIRIANLSERIDRIFAVTDLSSVFQVYESVDEALGSYE